MFKKIFSLTLIVCLIMAPAYGFNEVPTVTVGELTQDVTAYQKQLVRIQGEVLLEVLEQGNVNWVNIHDGTGAIGIAFNKDVPLDFSHFGDYQSKGDIIEVTGTFNRVCEVHGGDLDIHAVSYRIIKTGHEIKQSIDGVKVTYAIFLVVIASIMFMIYVRKVSKLDER